MSASARPFPFDSPVQTSLEAPESAVWPGLESCGLAVDDTLAALRVLLEGASILELRTRMAQGEVLSKRTLHGRKHFLLALRRRYVPAPPHLPPLSGLVRMLEHLESAQARAQCVLPYVLQGDRLAWEVASAVVLPRRAGDTLPLADVTTALVAALTAHGVKPWSDGLTKRWGQGFLSALREVGALGRHAQRERVLLYSVRPEVFSLHLLGLYLVGLRGKALRESLSWRGLLLSPEDVVRGLRAVSDRGWWRIHTIAAVEEYLPVEYALGEWGGDGVGRIPV